MIPSSTCFGICSGGHSKFSEAFLLESDLCKTWSKLNASWIVMWQHLHWAQGSQDLESADVWRGCFPWRSSLKPQIWYTISASCPLSPTALCSAFFDSAITERYSKLLTNSRTAKDTTKESSFFRTARQAAFRQLSWVLCCFFWSSFSFWLWLKLKLLVLSSWTRVLAVADVAVVICVACIKSRTDLVTLSNSDWSEWAMAPFGSGHWSSRLACICKCRSIDIWFDTSGRNAATGCIFWGINHWRTWTSSWAEQINKRFHTKLGETLHVWEACVLSPVLPDSEKVHLGCILFEDLMFLRVLWFISFQSALCLQTSLNLYRFNSITKIW